MKTLAVLLTVASFLLLAACESSTPPTPSSQAPGTSIGGGFHASGSVENGATISNR